MFEILIVLGGIWIALILAIASTNSARTATKNILTGFGVLFLLLQGGCCAWLINFDRDMGGSGNGGLIVPLSIFGAIIVAGIFTYSGIKK